MAYLRVFMSLLLLAVVFSAPLTTRAYADKPVAEAAAPRFTVDKDNIVSWRETDMGILITLNDTGKKALAEVTKANVDHKIDFYIGTELAASPIVRDPILGGQLGLSLSDDQRGKILALLPKDKMETAAPGK